MAKIFEITDPGQPELDLFCRLTEAQLRNRLEPEKGVFIAESPTVIGLALDAGCEPLALLTERKFIEGKAAGIIDRCGGVPIYTGEREVLAGLTGYELTRGVLCAMRRPAPRDFREIAAGARRVAVLENVVDSTNVGAIIRSAAALGIDAVLLRPPQPAGGAGKHGNGVPDPVGVYRGGPGPVAEPRPCVAAGAGL